MCGSLELEVGGGRKVSNFTTVRMLYTIGIQVHVGEYGVHWNFFFTLAAVSILTSIVNVPPNQCGILLSAICETAFHYQDKIRPMNYVVNVVLNMQMTLPQWLRKSPHSRLWYMPDTTFSTPKAYVKIEFNCLFTGSSPESEALTEIFMPYDAQVAGLYYGFQVTVLGYNHKIDDLTGDPN
ncbi:Peptidase M16 M domain-containing protein [Abeliophyllum distichum]|uniref:Peptidase M16 M domain-containing protein n=1 Tax=Abeliophyllum distichum TaxID=126358 RepID=A0ABD1TK33_9LAMI